MRRTSAPGRAPLPRVAPLFALLVAPLTLAACAGSRTGMPSTPGFAERSAVAAVLDDFHDAASDADFARYFGHFAEGGVFLGTDATERWTVEAFQDYARPYFSQGRGWTYLPRDREVSFTPDGRTAFFDELLDNEGLGETRGSGVLVLVDGRWKIAQYNLSIPIPNDLAGQVVEMIRRGGP